MKLSELYKKDVIFLKKKLYELFIIQFNLRTKHSVRKLENTSEFRKNRVLISRINTILRDRIKCHE